MDDFQIIKCIEERDKELFKNVKEIIDGYTTSITTLMTSENQNIKHSIDALTERVKRQNGSVRELNEWKARTEGQVKEEEKIELKKNRKFNDTLKTIGAVVAILALCFTAYFSFFGSKQSKINHTDIEMTNKMIEGFPVTTRGGYVHYDVQRADTIRNDSIK